MVVAPRRWSLEARARRLLAVIDKVRLAPVWERRHRRVSGSFWQWWWSFGGLGFSMQSLLCLMCFILLVTYVIDPNAFSAKSKSLQSLFQSLGEDHFYGPTSGSRCTMLKFSQHWLWFIISISSLVVDRGCTKSPAIDIHFKLRSDWSVKQREIYWRDTSSLSSLIIFRATMQQKHIVAATLEKQRCNTKTSRNIMRHRDIPLCRDESFASFSQV